MQQRNANTCSPGGVELARNVCALVEQYVGVPAQDVIVASTGVVGQPMSIEPFGSGMGPPGGFTGGHAHRRQARRRGHHDHRYQVPKVRPCASPWAQAVQAGRHAKGAA